MKRDIDILYLLANIYIYGIVAIMFGMMAYGTYQIWLISHEVVILGGIILVFCTGLVLALLKIFFHNLEKKD